MVGKLIKYDFMSFFRLLLPVQLIIIGIAAVNRIVQLFESEAMAYVIAFRSSAVLLGVACFVGLVMCVVIAIVRFYQGLYANEGYLSQTLPVTPAQLIVSKMLVSMIFEIGTIFAIFLALNVTTLGDMNVELYKAAGYLLQKAANALNGHLALYILEVLVLALVSMACGFLVFYFCISIGQLVNRKKILLAFGVFFGLYMLGQIIMTVFIIIGATNPPFWEQLLKSLSLFWKHHPFAAMHLFLCGSIVTEGILGLIFFLVSHVIMKKRLNLT